MATWQIIAWALWLITYSVFVCNGLRASWYWAQGYADNARELTKSALIAGYTATLIGGVAVIYG